MSFNFVADDLGRTKVVLLDEPDYVVALQIAPSRPEPILMSGKWLCVAMSVWSVHDKGAGEQAINRVKAQSGIVNLGLRPFNSIDEFSSWIPNFPYSIESESIAVNVKETGIRKHITLSGSSRNTPVWVTLSDGHITSVNRGEMSNSDIDNLLAMLRGE